MDRARSVRRVIWTWIHLVMRTAREHRVEGSDGGSGSSVAWSARCWGACGGAFSAWSLAAEGGRAAHSADGSPQRASNVAHNPPLQRTGAPVGRPGR